MWTLLIAGIAIYRKPFMMVEVLYREFCNLSSPTVNKHERFNFDHVTSSIEENHEAISASAKFIFVNLYRRIALIRIMVSIHAKDISIHLVCSENQHRPEVIIPPRFSD